MVTESDPIGTRAACDFCSTGFFCSRLQMALKILDTDTTLPGDPVRLESLGKIKKILADSKWDFNDGGRRCSLAGHTADVRALTEAVIALLPKRDAAKAKVKPLAPAKCRIDLEHSLLDEEHHLD